MHKYHRMWFYGIPNSIFSNQVPLDSAKSAYNRPVRLVQQSLSVNQHDVTVLHILTDTRSCTVENEQINQLLRTLFFSNVL